MPNAGDAGYMGSIPGLGRSPEGRNGNLLQYSCLGNSMGSGTWWTTVHGVTKSQTQLSMRVHIDIATKWINHTLVTSEIM